MKRFTILLALSLTGCALRSDVARLERQIAEDRRASARRDSVALASQAALVRLLQQVQDSLAAAQLAVTRFRGDVRGDLTDIRQQLIAVQELTGQSQQRLTELRGELASSHNTRPAPAPLPDSSRPAAAPPADETSAEQLLDLSLQQLRRGSPGTARAGFAEFLRRYPQHQRAADAVFFTGEAWAAEARADSAAAAWRAVVLRWPASSRSPTALYRLALAGLAAGRTAEARADLERLVQRYPTAEETPLARERLRTLPR